MRADGTRVKNADPMYTIAPFIMDKRYDAMNMITLDIPVKPMEDYIKSMRRQDRFISHMALVIAAYLKAAKEYPRLNRFIVNKRIYERNEFSVALVVLKPGEDNSTMSKIYLNPDDDIFTVQKKVEEYVSENKNTAEANNSMDRLLQTLMNMTGLLSVVVGLFKFLDKWGWLPKKLIDASPFHASLTISNLASIRTNHIYHHLYEFGTTSMFITIGNKREVSIRKKDQVTITRCLPLGVVMDERICSGSYYAKAFAKIRAYLNDPTLLEPTAAQA